MADEQEMVQLELFAKDLYETTNPVARIQLEKNLVQFSSSPDCLNKCQLLLERAYSHYTQLLAATTLTKLVSRINVSLPAEQRVDIRNYVLNYLATRPKLLNFVSQALVQLYARITKHGWFDTRRDNEFLFHDVIGDLSQFLNSGNTHHVMLGVQLLSQLVCEMNQVSEAEACRSFTKHRKTASSFRDAQLFEIFTLGCDLLKKANEINKTIDFSDPDQLGLVTHTLQLVLNCLTFDFIGTSTDESSDDLCTVQIPTHWRTAFLDGSTLTLFFDLYKCLPPMLSPVTLSCLVQTASVRRSLFNNVERAKFLNQLVAGIREILENPQSLSDAGNYHEFCRLLARLKSNYQLGELVKVDNYPEVIKLIAEFTITSLQMWHFPPNSMHYLLSLWQRMVAPVPYVKASEPHLLETYTPEVNRAYVVSRLDSVAVILREGLDDPLDDPAIVSQQLDQLSTIGRYEYKKTCTLLVQLFDEAVQNYSNLLSSGQTGIELAVQQGRLTWLVYIIGAVIGGRVSFASTDEHDEMDGELVCRYARTDFFRRLPQSSSGTWQTNLDHLTKGCKKVLQLMNLTDLRLPQGGGLDKFELAFLSFFEQFRKIYVGDQVQKTSRVYRRLSEVLGLCDESMVLGVFVNKIITNLKFWGGSESIIKRTLQLLSDLSVGYSSVRKLVKLDAVQFMLDNHKSEHFPFLAVNGASAQGPPLVNMHSRTTFYTALGRLLMVELGEDEERFERFMLPLRAAFDNLATLFSQADTPLFREEEAKRQVIGLARDLRGVAFAFNTKISYMMLFDWFYPAYTPILIRAEELWFHDPSVTTPILKLFAELAQNRSQRLQFDVSSPNGILLFREVSKVIVGYGSRILRLTDIPKEQLYPLKLKGVAVCFSMLKAALSGNYVNFGVFRLYGDGALHDALQTFVKLLLSITQSDLLEFPKLSQSYYALLECLAQDHMSFMSRLDPTVFLYILSTVSDGLTALDTMICTGCCATLDNIITYLFRLVTRKSPVHASSGGLLQQQQQEDNETFLRLLEHHPEILQQMLSTVLNVIMFEECRNQWSMSRPLLGLILLNEQYFAKLRADIVSAQQADKQSTMVLCFDSLMDGIDRTLLTKNRDRFTQNLSVFRHDINDSLKVPGVGPYGRTLPPGSTGITLQNDMMS